MLRANPFLGDESLEVAVEMCHAVMTEDEEQQWEQLDKILVTIAFTYEEDPKTVNDDVGSKIVEVDLQQMIHDELYPVDF